MSDAELNQLLEEAAVKSNELASHADAAGSAASELSAQAQALATFAIEQGRALHAEYEQAIAAIRHATEQAREAADAALAAASKVPDDAREAGTAVLELLKGVHVEVAELGETRARVVKEMSVYAEHANDEFELLGQQVTALTDKLESGVKGAQAELQGLRSAVEKGALELDEIRQKLMPPLLDLGSHVTRASAEATGAVQLLLNAASSAVLDLCNGAVHGANEVSASMRTGYVDETETQLCPSETWIERVLAPVREAIDGFEQLGPTLVSSVAGAMGVVVDSAGQAIESLSAVSRDLQNALPRID